VINIKVSAFAAAAAFVLSFLVGVISGAALLMVLVRALVFAAFFFILAGGIYMVIEKFLPELLPRETENAFGSQVDISLEDPKNGDPSGIFSDPEGGFPGESRDISLSGEQDLSGKGAGLDQNGEDGYTMRKKVEANAVDSGEGLSEESSFGESAALPSDSGSVDLLPDLESMTGTFVSSDGEAAEESTDYTSSRKPLANGKAPPVGGDFHPKDLASALQTILKRE
jgi:hypothetical protein